MFERFTDKARQVVAQMNTEALPYDLIGTEHLLLGLLHDTFGGVAKQALNNGGVTLDEVRAQVVVLLGEGAERSGRHVPFSPRCKKVLELSLREALQLGHNYINTEHLLLGLIREGEGKGVEILKALDVDLNRLRNEVVALISERDYPTPPLRPLSEIREELQGAANELLQAATAPNTPPDELLRRLQKISHQLHGLKGELRGR